MILNYLSWTSANFLQLTSSHKKEKKTLEGGRVSDLIISTFNELQNDFHFIKENLFIAFAIPFLHSKENYLRRSQTTIKLKKKNSTIVKMSEGKNIKLFNKFSRKWWHSASKWKIRILIFIFLSFHHKKY